MRVVRIALYLSIFSILNGSALAQKVNVDWDKSTDFSSYKTYTWDTGTPAKTPMLHARIIEDIDSQLTAKGLQKVEVNNNPDLVVVYHAATDIDIQMNTVNTGIYGPGWAYGWPGYGGMGTTTTYMDKILVGQLIVDIGDVKNKKYVWRGTASDTLSDKLEKVEKTINKAVTKMFKKYPPKVKK